MTTKAIFKEAQNFRSAIAINRIPDFVRVSFVSFCITAAVFLACMLIATYEPFVHMFSFENLFLSSSPLFAYSHLFIPLLCLALSLGLLGIGLNAYHAYFYLRGVQRMFGNHETDISYEVAEVFSAPNPTLSSLALHDESRFLIDRLNLDKEYMLAHFGNLTIPSSIPDSQMTLGSLWRAFYEAYPQFASYLLSQSVKKETFYRATVWMDRLLEDRKKAAAWWWRENLSKVRGFAKILSYGMTGYMSRYAEELSLDPEMSKLGDVILHQAECDQLEEILSKRRGANAVVIGPAGSGRHTVVLALARTIERGDAYAEIEYKRMFLLRASSFELMHEKVELENAIISIFNEAVVARNIIFVIDDVTKLVNSSTSIGVDFFSLIDPYIAHNSVSLVILTDETTASQDDYRRLFESRFESIKMRDVDTELFLPYLEDKAIAVEKSGGVYFTYQALEAVASALPAFFAEDAPLSKANAILESVAGTSSHAVVTESDIQDYLEKTTGVAQGAIAKDEKAQLLHLEEVLSQNVMGQKEAILAVAKTMRRVRSGITDKGKPMGTFLFLGPTGSGKTETAKTLAKVFFGSEEYMSRIDMGEYALSESAKRLLGDKDHEGDLAQAVHARPHGVLLLDEFEKSSKDVLDLFLRVLDEGVFTNGQGKLVSLRTQIVIATSNAGTELIRESHLSGDYDEAAFSSFKQTVLDSILEQGIFKPELVNRFDSTVMFLPLSNETLKGVAAKMLHELSLRMQEKGYVITWDEDLIEYVAEHANASEFGGRALQRVVQDTVEDALSKKIIEGSLKVGDKIVFSKADLLSV